MALPTNTFATYQAVGNREDLSDMIYRIDPTDTPFMSGTEKEKATAVNHEWQTQALAAGNTGNAQLEGDDPTTDATTPTVRLGNVCQISCKVAQVSGTQQAVEHAGRDNEMAYQEMLKGLELKRDIETILVGTNQAKVAGNSHGARHRLGPVVDRVQHHQGRRRRRSVCGRRHRHPHRRHPDRVHRGATEKRAVVDLDQRRQARHHHDRRLQQAGVLDLHRPRHPIEEAKSKKIVASVDAYESDFGKLKVVANRFQRAATCWCWKWTSGRSPISTAAT